MLPLVSEESKMVKMVKECPKEDCDYTTAEDIPAGGSITDHLTLLGYHVEDAHLKAQPPPQAVAAPAVARTEKFVCHKLAVHDGSVAEEDWEYVIKN
jgi:hypothetical protein